MGPSTNPAVVHGLQPPEPNLCRELSETAICCDTCGARTLQDQGQ